MNVCIDCKTNISDLRSEAKRCKECYKRYRKQYFAKYRKSEKRKETIRKDNASNAAKLRKRMYNRSIKGMNAHLKYRQTEKGRTSRKAQVLKRRAKVKNIGGDLSATEIRRIKEEYDACALCGEKSKLEIEHLVPISRGGTNDYQNLVMACRKCNMMKFNLKTEEFFMKCPEKQKYFLQVDANKRKWIGIKCEENIKEDRIRKCPEIWTREKLKNLVELWPTASKERLAKEFPHSTYDALKNIVAKLRSDGIKIQERINKGRFIKKIFSPRT